MWDREGNGLGTKAVDGSLKGFTVGMIQAQDFLGLLILLLNVKVLHFNY